MMIYNKSLGAERPMFYIDFDSHRRWGVVIVIGHNWQLCVHVGHYAIGIQSDIIPF